MGTKGVGRGLDDEALDPVWEALEKEGLVVFVHPHYGVDKEAWGEKENGHVLPLALGFPFETTIVRNVYLVQNALADNFHLHTVL
jgi:predicted TIM-barrel fold metal-dependent hydrolase